jgi:hypothetical protein
MKCDNISSSFIILKVETMKKLFMKLFFYIFLLSFIPNLQAWTNYRNDVVTQINSKVGGKWGSWQESIFCDPRTYVRGFELQVEPPQRRGRDDTALNNIKLFCANKSGDIKEEIISGGSPGWGRWGSQTMCESRADYAHAFRLRVEPPQRRGRDDTAANSMELVCSSCVRLTPSNGGHWGSWGPFVYCPSGSAICGMSLKIEARLRRGRDDTSVNDVNFYCCSR